MKIVYIIWRDYEGNYVLTNITYNKDLSEYTMDQFLDDAFIKEYGNKVSKDTAYVITVFTALKNGENYFYY